MGISRQNSDLIRYIHDDQSHNLKAPSIIVPDLIRMFRPRSVVDVGCGIGTFLRQFQNEGVSDVLGLDGGWVRREKLYVDETCFREVDLELPVALERKFDLVISLEVAEHLKSEAADDFVKTLCSAGDLIVFSAALPGQGGQQHINEQSFDYWQDKFELLGFHLYDCFRPMYWHDQKLDWWYKQNMFLISSSEDSLSNDIVSKKVRGKVMSYYHPDLYALRSKNDRSNIRSTEIRSAKEIIGYGIRTVKNRILHGPK